MNISSMPNSWNSKTKPDLFCPGCGHGIILKQLGFALDEAKLKENIALGIDIGCSLLAWNFFNIDTIQAHHGRTIPVMAGYKMNMPESIALAYMGDGGGYAIGLQSLIHAAFRNDPITVIVVNNTNYAMTGGQAAPTTLPGQVTATTPNGTPAHSGCGFKGPELLTQVSHKDAYIARATVNKPLILKKCLKEAILNQQKNNSFSFIEVLSICPTNWKMAAKACFLQLEKMEEFYPVGILKGGKNE